MADYHISDAAQLDLEDIWFYIAQDSPTQADRMLERIFEACGNLAASPYSGRSRSELGEGLRNFPENPYMIFYTVEGQQDIVIRRVIHSSRDIEQQFEKG